MTEESFSHLTQCGLPGIDRIPYGTHACHFYRDRDELIAALTPYFAAGLEANELCLWVTAPPLPAREAVQALRTVWERADDAIQNGSLRILDHELWYANSTALKGFDVVELWLKEEERALAEGYSGLRITGNTSFLTPEGWSTFMEYERAVTERFHGRRVVALCSYALAQCDSQHMSEVMCMHQCTFERSDADWQVVTAPGV
jgi:two-component system, sensor histidine kinase PdtaS